MYFAATSKYMVLGSRFIVGEWVCIVGVASRCGCVPIQGWV